MNIKAIDTIYRGWRFRSRLEARWAVFFDQLAIAYQYELQGYELPSGKYLPDFWLPSLACWVEVKPESPSAEEIKLCEELADGLLQPVVIISGTPGSECLRVYCGDVSDGSAGGGQWWEPYRSDRGPYWALTKEGTICICSGDDRYREYWNPSFNGVWPTMQDVHACRRETFAIDRAYRLARSARFEFGETPR